MKRFQKFESIVISIILVFSIVVFSPLHVNGASEVSSIISVAQGEVGKTDRTRYGAKEGENWCAYFVSWCARQAGIPSSSVPNLSQADGFWYAENATLHYFFKPWLQKQRDWGIEKGTYCSSRSQYTPQIGDMIFFRWNGTDSQYTFSHIGIVYNVDSSKVYTIEGNTGSPRSVRYKEYSRDNVEIVAYGTPIYKGSTSPSQIVSVPAVPTGVNAVQYGSETATISWNAVADAGAYEVQYFSRDYNSWRDDWDYKNKTSTSYVSTGLARYDSYQYRVRAVNSAGASGWAEFKYIKPTVEPAPEPTPEPAQPSSTTTTITIPENPTGATAVKYGSETATISWNAVSGATSYEVQYYSRDHVSWRDDWDYTNKTATSYISTGLARFDTYQYRIRAVNAAGVSAWTEFIYVKPTDMPAPTAPSVPSGISAVKYGSETATISWNAVSGATSYEVQYYNRDQSVWKDDWDYTNKTATSYISTGLARFSSYQYRVRAINSAGVSAWAEFTYYKP